VKLRKVCLTQREWAWEASRFHFKTTHSSYVYSERGSRHFFKMCTDKIKFTSRRKLWRAVKSCFLASFA